VDIQLPIESPAQLAGDVGRLKISPKSLKRSTFIVTATVAKTPMQPLIEIIKQAEERGYLRAKEEFEKIALSCCCSGCTKHNKFLIEGINGEIHSIHEQPSQEIESPHGSRQSEHLSD
jgi:hypothetical protein